MAFSHKIIEWYQSNKREMPWRANQDPYRIWLSEVILQQTRVAQGLPYFEAFIEAYPTVSDLANASLDEVLKLWQGLGYYSRARNLHETAKTIKDKYSSTFPDNYRELIKLKGVGDYTASAIASICFNEACAVVDGNVYRVLARFFGVATPINSSQGQKEFKALAQACLYSKMAGTYNQALMEFGSLHCTPNKPDCIHCPLQQECFAYGSNRVADFPVKISKVSVKKQHYNFIVFLDSKKHTIIEQRKGSGIWEGLYQFPLLETSQKANQKEVIAFASQSLHQEVKEEQISTWNTSPWVHKLSHRHLITQFWIVSTEKHIKNGCAWEELNTFAVPVLIANFIDAFKI